MAVPIIPYGIIVSFVATFVYSLIAKGLFSAPANFVFFAALFTFIYFFAKRTAGRKSAILALLIFSCVIWLKNNYYLFALLVVCSMPLFLVKRFKRYAALFIILFCALALDFVTVAKVFSVISSAALSMTAAAGIAAVYRFAVNRKKYNWNLPVLTSKQKVYADEAYQKQQNGMYRQQLADFDLELKGKNVLDIGCGPGQWIKEVSMNKPRIAVGTDMDIKFLKIAQEHNPLAGFVRCSATELPFKDNSVDVLFSMLVMPYVKNDALFISECARVLRPGGRFIVSGHELGFPLRYIRKAKFSPLIIYAATFIYMIFGEKVYLNTLQSSKTITKFLKKNGLLVKKVQLSEKTLGLAHTFLIKSEKRG